MHSTRVISAVDSHTEGMPTRVVTGGIPPLPGATMGERMRWLVTHDDELRTLLMYEPRGHAAMSGALLQPPLRPDADWGVVFIEVTGCLPMCGHGTIGVATVLVETGMVPVVEPVTTIRLDTPAGLVVVDVEVSGGRARSVTLTNVPAFVEALDIPLTLADGRTVTLDIGFGGNYYAMLPASEVGVKLDPAEADSIVGVGMDLLRRIQELPEPVHPEQPDIHGIHHVILSTDDDVDFEGNPVDGRAATVIHPGWIDRSPCGTGTSARMAVRHSRGLLPLHTDYRHASLLGTTFTGRLIAEETVAGRPAVRPTIRGRAWVTGINQYLLADDDPFPAGFLLGATHGTR